MLYLRFNYICRILTVLIGTTILSVSFILRFFLRRITDPPIVVTLPFVKFRAMSPRVVAGPGNVPPAAGAQHQDPHLPARHRQEVHHPGPAARAWPVRVQRRSSRAIPAPRRGHHVDRGRGQGSADAER